MRHLAAGDFLDALNGIFLAGVDDILDAKALGEVQALLHEVEQDGMGTVSLGNHTGNQADGACTDDGAVLAGLQAGEYCAIIGAGPIGLVAGMVAQAYGAHAILLDLVQERLDFAKSLGIEYVINSGKEDPVERIKEITGGEMAHQVMECSGANPAIRQTFDLVSNAGRITLTGWPKKETSLPTDVITKKEIDIRGARTSAGEFEEALDLINSRKVDMMKILTKTVTMDEAPDTIVDIEKNPGNYMKVVVRVSNDD